MRRWMLSLAVFVPAWVWSSPNQEVFDEAERWLRSEFSHIKCSGDSFVYGVGYIDGSYMERIFFTDNSGATPSLVMEFRNSPVIESTSGNVSNLAFVLEVDVGRSQYAQLSGGSWVRPDQEWEDAMRFKYTSWFGQLSRIEGQWSAEYEGYRRPMLPDELLQSPDSTCAIFESAL